MTKRIEANTATHAELKASLSDVSDLMEGQASNANSRFTSIDNALREVDRGVQVGHHSLRGGRTAISTLLLFPT